MALRDLQSSHLEHQESAIVGIRCQQPIDERQGLCGAALANQQPHQLFARVAVAGSPQQKLIEHRLFRQVIAAPQRNGR